MSEFSARAKSIDASLRESGYVLARSVRRGWFATSDGVRYMLPTLGAAEDLVRSLESGRDSHTTNTSASIRLGSVVVVSRRRPKRKA